MNFYLQALVLVVTSIIFCQRRGRIDLSLLAISTAWFVGVSFIFWKYGDVGQNYFYQNDQSFHWQIVAERISSELGLDFRQLNALRVPYTLPAFVLANLGFNATLSLKFVSLCCALANIVLVRKFLIQNGSQWSIFSFWIVAGPMMTFFSMLALRETMMLLCVTYFFLGRATQGKLVSLIALAILRPHLAAAVLVGKVWGFALKNASERVHLVAAVSTAILPIYLGIISFPLGQMLLNQRPFDLDRNLFSKDQVLQVFSAFAALQFTTVASQTVEFATRSLILVRVIFPEIMLIPILFVVSCLLHTPKLSGLKFGILAAFVFFTSVSTGTDFLSVRQSLPFMTTLGAIAILSISRTSMRAKPKIATSGETLNEVV
jgi:hypothetical protein